MHPIDIVEAAVGVWSFLILLCGRVGCLGIGVDLYYLTHKEQEIGNYTAGILAGRRINDSMGGYVPTISSNS